MLSGNVRWALWYVYLTRIYLPFFIACTHHVFRDAVFWHLLLAFIIWYERNLSFLQYVWGRTCSRWRMQAASQKWSTGISEWAASVLFISTVHSLYLALCVYNGTECLTLYFKAHNTAHLWVLPNGCKALLWLPRASRRGGQSLGILNSYSVAQWWRGRDPPAQRVSFMKMSNGSETQKNFWLGTWRSASL